MTTEILFQVLSRIHPLPGTFKEALRRELKPISYPKNHFLVQMDAVAGYAYFLHRGFAVAYHFVDGEKVVTSFFRPHDIVFSPKSFFRQVDAQENIQLTVDSDLIAISYASLNRLFDEFPVANFLARVLTAEYYSRAQERQVDFYSLNAWEWYQKVLRSFPGIEQHVSQEFIASYLTVTPQSLSRLRRRNR